MKPKRKAIHENPDPGPLAHRDKRRHVVREARRRLERHEYTVGWICAIVTEYVAAQELLDEEHERHHDLPFHDAGHYTLGKIGPHNFVMTVLPAYGTSASAAVARDMMHSFSNVSFGLMVGIGGGAPSKTNDIRLGDIVVGTARNEQSSVVQYDFGKTIQGQGFRQIGVLNQPPWRLSTAVNGLQARHKRYGHQIEETINHILDDNPNLKGEYGRPSPQSDKLYRSNIAHPPHSEEPCAAVCGYDPSKLVQRPARAVNKLVILYGAIASGNQVMKDALARDKFAVERNFLCFEMEAAGLSNNLPCLVIRGICDYSDSHKNNEWQGYAAMAAAAYAKEFLYELSPPRSLPLASTSTQLWNSDLAADRESLDNKERRQELLEELTFKQIYARQTNIKRAHAETCEWVLKSSTYLSWLDHTKRNIHHGFLWIKGKPGAGKSTIMKFISAKYRMTMQQSTLITFFFNARGEQLEKSTVGMYRSLLYQLIESLPQLRTILDFKALMSPANRHREWTLESLKDLFEDIVMKLKYISVTCFIDALDECDEDQIRNMVSFFDHISEGTTREGVSFQVCFSSRHYPYITISKAVTLILEEQRGHQNDIENYVSSKLKIGNSKISRQMHFDLQQKASGVFMWVVLVVDILNKEYDGGRLHRLRERLQEIPSDLNTLFRDILFRDCHRRDELLLCIQWVLFAKEPLSPEQLYFAILSGIEIESTKALYDWDAEDITPGVMKLFVLGCSKGLTEVAKSDVPTIQFIHESVRDFLLKQDGLTQIWSEFGSNFSGKCHERLKLSCVKYLTVATSMEIGNTLPDASSEQANELRESAGKRWPFLRYATQQVLYHSDEAEATGISQLSFIQTFDLAGWTVLDNIFEDNGLSRHTPTVSLLYVLAEQNRANLIRIYRSIRACFQVENERYGAPIFAALATGSSEAVNSFLTAHKQANANSIALKDFNMSSSQVQETTTSSRKACDFIFTTETGMFLHGLELGNGIVTFLLLELGNVVTRMPDAFPRAPISYAAEMGSLAVCHFLCETDHLHIDLKDDKGITPLSHAARCGHIGIVRLLIESGRVDIEKRDKDGRTPLSHAAGKGHFSVVRLLLETSGTDVDSRSKSGRTPLSYAASSYDSVNVLELLLETHKVDVNSTDALGRTPLSYAASCCSGNSRVLLANANVSVDSRDLSGRTPLSYAAFDGSLESVDLLLNTAEAEVDSKDESGRTPLSYAAQQDRIHTVSLLLDKGGADPSCEDLRGWTPSTYASRGITSDMYDLLRSRT